MENLLNSVEILRAFPSMLKCQLLHYNTMMLKCQHLNIDRKRVLKIWDNHDKKQLDRYYVTLFSTFGMLKSLLKLLKTLISSGFLKIRKLETVFFRTFSTKTACQ